MIELNCFCSPDLEKNTPVTGQIAFLETFWDSGQARYGTFTAENLYMVTLGQNRPLLKEMANVRKVLPLLQVQIIYKLDTVLCNLVNQKRLACYKKNSSRGFINIFSKRAPGFHRWEKLFG